VYINTDEVGCFESVVLEKKQDNLARHRLDRNKAIDLVGFQTILKSGRPLSCVVAVTSEF